jgi:hypothetical protein
MEARSLLSNVSNALNAFDDSTSLNSSFIRVFRMILWASSPLVALQMLDLANVKKFAVDRED